MSITQNHAGVPVAGAPARAVRPPAGGEAAQTQLWSFGGSATCSATLCRPEDDLAWQRLFAGPVPKGVTVRGAGASYSDAALNQGGTVATTPRQARVVGWDPRQGLLEVDGGMTLGEILSFCVPRGWTLPVLPGTARATAGGAFAADVHGKNHPRSGSFSSSVEQIVLISPGQGVLAVGPTDRPDAFWATAGGMGLTGVVRRLRLRLAPISTSWLRTTDTTCGDLEEVLDVMTQQARLHQHVVGWIDGHATRGCTGRGVVSTADHLDVADLPARLRDRPLTYRPRPWRIGAPATVNMVRPSAVRVANAVRFARARHRSPGQLRPFPGAFHPLDGVTDWPVLYGRRGLVQYQFCVPLGEEHVLMAALQELPRADCPPSLVTLKRFGPQSPAQLSFPEPGWTLALDLPTAAALSVAWLLDRLDRLVCAAGGRVYLVKNSSLHPDLVAQMYPRLEEWRAVRRRLDPDAVLTSDLDRRLNLTGRQDGRPSC